MGRRRCCCGCWSVSDNFNRSDSSDITPFRAISGTWAIDSSRLKATGLGLAIHGTPQPRQTLTGVVTVTCKNLQIGNEYILFLNYAESTGNYEGVKLTVNNASECGIAFVGVAGGVGKSPLSHDGIGTDLTLSLCRSKTGIYADVSTASYFMWACVPAGPPDYLPYAGVENPKAGTTIYFDDFSYSEHHATNSICPACECECDDWCVPKTLLATFRASGSHCSALDGESIQLDSDDTVQPTIGWRGQDTLPGCDNPSGTDDWDLGLRCDPDGPASFLLCNYDLTCVDVGWGLNGAECEGQEAAYPSSYSCGPAFLMTFGPFSVEISGLGTVCTYYIDITEGP